MSSSISVKSLSQLVETDVRPWTFCIAFCTSWALSLSPSTYGELMRVSTVALILESAVAPKSKTSLRLMPSKCESLSRIRSSSCQIVCFLSKRFTAFMVIVASAGKFPLPRLSTPGSVPKATELIFTHFCASSHLRIGSIFFSALSTLSFELNATCALIIPVSIGGIASLPIVGMIFFKLNIKIMTTPIVSIMRRKNQNFPFENLIIPTYGATRRPMVFW